LHETAKAGLTVELDLPAFVVLGEDREFDPDGAVTVSRKA